MITYHRARQVAQNLEGDPDTRALILAYIDQEQRGPKDWEALTDRDHSVRAANRAVEAISRVGTLTSDIATLNDRVASLEGVCLELEEMLVAALRMIEGG